MKKYSRIIGSKALSILVVLCLTACSDDSGSPGPPDNECEGEDVYGPAGRDNRNYGFQQCILWITYCYPGRCPGWTAGLFMSMRVMPQVSQTGASAYPDYNAQFDLSTGGDKPYDLELEFYFPVKGHGDRIRRIPLCFRLRRKDRKMEHHYA